MGNRSLNLKNKILTQIYMTNKNKQLREKLESIFRTWKTLDNTPNAKTAIRNLFDQTLASQRQAVVEEIKEWIKENTLNEMTWGDDNFYIRGDELLRCLEKLKNE